MFPWDLQALLARRQRSSQIVFGLSEMKKEKSEIFFPRFLLLSR